MNPSRILRWARRRAGLTQRELAERTGVAQPTIARIETGRETPRITTLDRLLRACGLMLEAIALEGVGVDRSLVRGQLGSPPEARAAFAQRGADVRAETARARAAQVVTSDLFGVLATLTRHDVRFVVVGGLAANLLGSPVLTSDVDICYARDDLNLERLPAALTELGATLREAPEGLPFVPDAPTLRAGDRFTFDTLLGPLDIMGRPHGTEGYEQLRRTARTFEVADVRVWVCSLDDLILMKRAAGRPKDRIMVEELVALREERDRLNTEGRDLDAGA